MQDQSSCAVTSLPQLFVTKIFRAYTVLYLQYFVL